MGRKDGVVIEGLPSLIDYLCGKEKNFRVFYQIDKNEEMEFVARCCEAKGNMILAIDEMDMFSTPYFTGPRLSHLIKRGRHCGVGIIGCSRRPAEVSKLFTSQSHEIVVFATHEPRDIEYLSSFMPNAREAAKLPLYKYILWQ